MRAAGENARAAAGDREEFGPFAPADQPLDQRGESQRRYQANEQDRVIVIVLAGEGIPHEVIARTLNRPHGICVESLQYHYGRELVTAKADLLAQGWARVISTMNNPTHRDSFKASAFMIQRLSTQLAKSAANQHQPEDDFNLDPMAAINRDIIVTPGKISFTLKIGESEPLDADKIGTRDTLDPVTDVDDLNDEADAA